MPDPLFLLATLGYGQPKFQLTSVKPFSAQNSAKRRISSASLLSIWGTKGILLCWVTLNSSDRVVRFFFLYIPVKKGVNSLSTPLK